MSLYVFHRGDLQYKEVKISSEVLLENVGHLLPAGQLVYIATDVKEKDYFDGLKARFPNVSDNIVSVILSPPFFYLTLKFCFNSYVFCRIILRWQGYLL